MPRIRAFRAGDEAAFAEICLRTADAGGDGTGLLQDDDLWAQIFVLPYVARHPQFAFAVETDDERVVGYVVAAPDTDAFEDWFASAWWPRFAHRWPRPAGESSRQDDILRYAYARRAGAEPYAAAYPAHLHIDLLPQARGGGWGRRLIETEVAALAAVGVPGVHLVASSENAGALAFYPRVGFTAIPSHTGVQAFAREL